MALNGPVVLHKAAKNRHTVDIRTPRLKLVIVPTFPAPPPLTSTIELPLSPYWDVITLASWPRILSQPFDTAPVGVSLARTTCASRISAIKPPQVRSAMYAVLITSLSIAAQDQDGAQYTDVVGPRLMHT
jgi:hypothetical protein